MALARFAQRMFIPARVGLIAGPLALLALAAFQAFGRFSLVSLALICVMILAAGAVPVLRKSRLVEKAALVSFSMFITNEVVRIGYFGVVNVLEARLHAPAAAQWALWAGGVVCAVLFALGFHYVVDMPTQRWLNPKGGRGARTAAGARAGAAPEPEAASVPAI
jgi:peptidoglycan/LPS O-acetylase OafA/YrhL